MSLTDGEISEYNELMRSSIETFLVKLENAVNKILRQQPEEEILPNENM
jgi:hypothetical protein